MSLPAADTLALRAADIEALDQPVFDPKQVADNLIRQQIAIQVAHHLMYFHDDFPLRSGGERDRLHVRIDHGPLARPVTAYAVPPVDMSAFQSICPYDILVHGGEHRLHIALVESAVNMPEEFYFVRH